MTKKRPDPQARLEKAYRLKTPADNVAYYRKFAADYDSGFAAGLGYSYPASVAAIYQTNATEHDVPLADIGCGTGLVGAALRGLPVDGFDISPEMLERARARGCYRALYEVDLTAGVDGLPHDYGAVISAGTFTHGHLGPEDMIRLIPLGRPGALFVIGVNRDHYRERGFEPALARLEDEELIRSVTETEVPIYSKAGHDHSGDMALVLTWRLTG